MVDRLPTLPHFPAPSHLDIQCAPFYCPLYDPPSNPLGPLLSSLMTLSCQRGTHAHIGMHIKKLHEYANLIENIDIRFYLLFSFSEPGLPRYNIFQFSPLSYKLYSLSLQFKIPLCFLCIFSLHCQGVCGVCQVHSCRDFVSLSTLPGPALLPYFFSLHCPVSFKGCSAHGHAQSVRSCGPVQVAWTWGDTEGSKPLRLDAASPGATDCVQKILIYFIEKKKKKESSRRLAPSLHQRKGNPAKVMIKFKGSWLINFLLVKTGLGLSCVYNQCISSMMGDGAVFSLLPLG